MIAWPFDGDPPAVRINGQLTEWPKTGLHIRATGEPLRIEVARVPGAISEHQLKDKDG